MQAGDSLCKRNPLCKAGRPPNPPGTQKEFTLRVRMSEAMRDKLFSVAKIQKASASEFVRKLLQDALGVR